MPKPTAYRFPRQRRRGFTLIELMVVILILGLLAGALAFVIPGVFSKNKEKVAANEIQSLKVALQSFERELGTFPPNNLADLPRLFRSSVRIASANNVNGPNESMLLCLRSRKHGGPFLTEDDILKEGKLVNTDSDKRIQNISDVEGEAIPQELADPWGNPYIYLNLKGLKNQAFQYQDAEGTAILIDSKALLAALKDKENGRMKAHGFVIWSLGEDGKNEYGGGDDVASWH